VLLGDDQPLGGGARLTGVLHPAHGRGLDRGGEVVGVEDDERVAAAELEHRLLQVLAGQGADGAAGALAAGQRHPLDAGVGDDLLDVGDAQEGVGEDARRGAGVGEQLLEGERALRDVLACLRTTVLPSTRFGPATRTDLVEGVVPRLDGQQHTDRPGLDDRLPLPMSGWMGRRLQETGPLSA
jgi:hypothetical protein